MNHPTGGSGIWPLPDQCCYSLSVPRKISYSTAGVDITNADTTKREMAESLKTKNPLVLNSMGAFSSVCEGVFPGFKHPVLVCKTEEPGSKQLLAFKYNRVKGICHDLINHLVNDIMVMGAVPMFIQDLIVCGKIEKEVIKELVKHIAAACTAQGAVLTGGETSEQPAVLASGTYVLGASCIGVAEKGSVIDGSAIESGDVVLALESSGPHTNGYTLIRALINQDPSILQEKIDRSTFLDLIMEPHRCYFQTIKHLFTEKDLHGMAHITGGGIPGNLNRILPEGMDAVIDASMIKILPIFRFIKEKSQNDDADMIKTFNLGVGLNLVVATDAAERIAKDIIKRGVNCYPIGTMQAGGTKTVQMKGQLSW
jgi:phosphoribosylformylglycinamidine cyclo-ligase